MGTRWEETWMLVWLHSLVTCYFDFFICKWREFNWRWSIPDTHCGSNNDSIPITGECTGKKEIWFFSLHVLFCPSPFLHMSQITLIHQLINSHLQLHSPLKLDEFRAFRWQWWLLPSSNHILPLHHKALLATVCLGQSSLCVSFYQELPPICRVLVHQPLWSGSRWLE